jgi:hypothetical protein
MAERININRLAVRLDIKQNDRLVIVRRKIRQGARRLIR